MWAGPKGSALFYFPIRRILAGEQFKNQRDAVARNLGEQPAQIIAAVGDSHGVGHNDHYNLPILLFSIAFEY
jgi:hypothetical protein